MPTARKPSKETAAVLLVVALAAYLTSAAFLAAPAAPVADAKNILSRPWDLLPAALYLVAAVCFGQRIKNDKDKKSNASLFDYALLMVASLNAICHVSAAFSRQLFDGPFFLAELSKTFSYVVMLAGALLDQARLFEQVRSMAVSDPLECLAAEAEASAFSVRAFVATFPEDCDTPEKLLAAADRALYIMKHGGRSSVQNLARIAACL